MLERMPKTETKNKKTKPNYSPVLFLTNESLLHPLSDDSLPWLDYPLKRNTSGKSQARIPYVPSEQLESAVKPFFQSSLSYLKKPLCTDAKLLAYPIRTIRGLYTWCTSINLLSDFLDDLSKCACRPNWKFSEEMNHDAIVLVGRNNRCLIKKRLVLEQFSFPTKNERIVEIVGNWLSRNAFPLSSEFGWWRAKIAQDLVILPDELLSNLIETTAPIQIEISSNNTNCAREYVPNDAIFYSVLNKTVWNNPLEISHTGLGEQTLYGMGMCRLHMLRFAKKKRNRKRKPNKKEENGEATEDNKSEDNSER